MYGGKKRFVPVDTQSIISPNSQPTEVPPPSKPPRKRHPSFDLQALLAPRRGTSTPKPAEPPVGGPSRNSPMSWLGRRAVADPVITTSMATAISSWGGSGGGGGGGVLIRGVEVSSKEVVDHTGSPRQHVLLGRTEREMGADRAGSTTQRFNLFILLQIPALGLYRPSIPTFPSFLSLIPFHPAASSTCSGAGCLAPRGNTPPS